MTDACVYSDLTISAGRAHDGSLQYTLAPLGGARAQTASGVAAGGGGGAGRGARLSVALWNLSASVEHEQDGSLRDG